MRNKIENQLLRLCCRTHADAQCAERIAVLSKLDLDWEFVLTFAHYHKVVPLVHKNLFARGSAPDFVIDRLNRTRKLNTINLLSRVGALTKIVAAMSAAGIEALPYKGPLLALIAYGDISLRMCGDIDLMVKSADVPAAIQVLTGLGYRTFQDADGVEAAAGEDFESDTSTEDTVMDEVGYHRAFVSENGLTIVELHWHFRPRYVPMSLDIEQLWQQLETVPFAGAPVLSFPLEPLLVLLSAHGTKHRWSRMMWLCDIAELIRKHPDLDWDKVCHTAKSMGMTRNLSVGLWLAHSLLDAPIPQDVLASCSWMCRNIADSIARDTLEKTRTQPGRFAMAIYNLAIVERRDTRLAAMLGSLTGANGQR